MKIAKWMGVPPWDLLDMPPTWVEWGQIAMGAEVAAEEQLAAKNRPKKPAGRTGIGG